MPVPSSSSKNPWLFSSSSSSSEPRQQRPRMASSTNSWLTINCLSHGGQGCPQDFISTTYSLTVSHVRHIHSLLSPTISLHLWNTAMRSGRHGTSAIMCCTTRALQANQPKAFPTEQLQEQAAERERLYSHHVPLGQRRQLPLRELGLREPQLDSRSEAFPVLFKGSDVANFSRVALREPHQLHSGFGSVVST